MREPAQDTHVAPHRRAQRAFWGRLVTACALVVFASFARGAQAQTVSENVEPRVCIDWRAPPDSSCASRALLVSKVEEVLGRRTNSPEICDQIIEATIQRNTQGKGFSARLAIRGADGGALGSRELTSEHPSCGALSDPVALVLALMIENAKQHARLHVEPPVTHNEAKSEAGPRFRAASGLSVVSGLLNAFGMGPELRFAALLGGRASLELEGGAWFPVSGSEARSGRFWSATGGARLCFETLAREPRIGICGGARSGVLHGKGTGLDYELSTSRPYAEAHAELKGAFRLHGALGLVAHAGIGLPFVRPEFVYLDVDASRREVHRPASLVSYAGLALELDFGAQRGGP
jgi:hypothetical protein